MKKYGLKGLYLGWQARIMQYMIQSAFTLIVIEDLKYEYKKASSPNNEKNKLWSTFSSIFINLIKYRNVFLSKRLLSSTCCLVKAKQDSAHSCYEAALYFRLCWLVNPYQKWLFHLLQFLLALLCILCWVLLLYFSETTVILF